MVREKGGESSKEVPREGPEVSNLVSFVTMVYWWINSLSVETILTTDISRRPRTFRKQDGPLSEPQIKVKTGIRIKKGHGKDCVVNRTQRKLNSN